LARVLQVGVGKFGKNHKRILDELGVLAATVDINGYEDYTDIEDVVERYTHVVIATPIDTHAELVRRFHNKHVFVEKPMATSSLETANLLVNTTKKLQVGMIERYNPIVQEISDNIHGQVTFVREGPRTNNDNILWDTTIHDIDLALLFFQETPEKIVGQASRDRAEIHMKFSYGNATILTDLTRPRHRSINGRSIITNENILKYELQDFISDRPNTCWEAFGVASAIEEVNQ
jgi:predicted dehydrogenase